MTLLIVNLCSLSCLTLVTVHRQLQAFTTLQLAGETGMLLRLLLASLLGECADTLSVGEEHKVQVNRKEILYFETDQDITADNFNWVVSVELVGVEDGCSEAWENITEVGVIFPAYLNQRSYRLPRRHSWVPDLQEQGEEQEQEEGSLKEQGEEQEQEDEQEQEQEEGSLKEQKEGGARNDETFLRTQLVGRETVTLEAREARLEVIFTSYSKEEQTLLVKVNTPTKLGL